MGLLSKLFWIGLTVVFTFCFVVLFENGTVNFADNAQRQFAEVKTYFDGPPAKPSAPAGKPR